MEDYGIEKLQPGIIDGVGIMMITEKESLIPHFTIIRPDGSEVVIMIQDNKYLSKNSLTDEECIKLNSWVREHEEKTWYNLGSLNWEHVITCWNGLYNGYEITYTDDTSDIPDYTTIKPCD